MGNTRIGLLTPQVHDSTDAFAAFHDLEGGVDVGELLPVGDELVDLEPPIQVVLNQAR